MKLYGIAEIAEALQARSGTVAQWYKRDQLPAPDAVLKMGPVWSAETLNAARRTLRESLKKAEADLRGLEGWRRLPSMDRGNSDVYRAREEVTRIGRDLDRIDIQW